MKDVLKLALEALENALNKPMWDRPKMTKTITAIKEALAQPEKGLFIDLIAQHDGLAEELAQDEQEPVHSVQSNGRHSPLLTHMMNKRTAPPKRPWVGLTDKEVRQTLINYNMGALPHRFDCIKAIEAKLKELNT